LAHNTRIRPNLAAWAPDTAVLDTEFNALDQGQFTAINGDDGGTWAPSSAIVIGGSGIEMDGQLKIDTTGSILAIAGATLDGNFSTGGLNFAFTGAPIVFTSGGLNCVTTVSRHLTGSTVKIEDTSTMEFEGTAKCQFETGTELETQSGSIVDIQAGTTYTNAAAASFTGAVQFTSAGSTTFDALATMTAGLSLTTGGTLNVASAVAAQFSNTPNFANGFTLTGGVGDIDGVLDFTQGTDGQARWRDVTLPDTNSTIDPSTGTFFHASGLANSNTHTLASATAGDWVVIEVTNASANQLITDGAGFNTNLRDNTSGDRVAVMIFYDGASWRIFTDRLRP
jgi:hypothetical protein